MKRMALLLALAWFGSASAQAPPAALGPLQALVSITAPTMHDVGLAEACKFIHPATASRMRSYLGARVRGIGGKIAGAGPASFAAASAALDRAFAAGLAGHNRAACIALATSADRMRGLYDLRNRLPPPPPAAPAPKPNGLMI